MQERKSRSNIKVGDRIESKNCGFFTVLERNGDYSIVRFDTGYTATVDTDNILSGQIKDPLYPQVLGVGYFGIGPYKNKMGSANKGFNSTPEYNAWQNMLQRCYYDKYICRVDGFKTYDNVEVVPEWHNFQNFAEWYVPRRKLFDDNNIKRPALDKDILAPALENRVYGPETCCLVPDEINGALVGIHNECGGIVKSNKGYYYLIQKAKRISDYIYDFNEIKELRRKYKEEYLQSLANKYQHVIEPRVYDRLCNWFN